MTTSDPGDLLVVVRTMERGDYPVTISPAALVRDLKARVAGFTGVPVPMQRLLRSGRELEDSQPLGNLPEGCVMHMVERAAPPARQQPARQQQPGGPQPGPEHAAGFGAMPPGLLGILQQGLPGMPDTAMGPFSVNVNAGGATTAAGVPVGLDQLDSLQALQALFGPSPPAAMAPPSVSTAGFAANVAAGPPAVDTRGQLTSRHAFEGLDRMLRRLENVNMEADTLPNVSRVPPGSMRDATQDAAWSTAAAAFLRSTRPVLEGAELNRETLAVINRVLQAAGLRPLSLGVRSFPLDPGAGSDDNDGGDDVPEAAAEQQQDGSAGRLAAAVAAARTVSMAARLEDSGEEDGVESVDYDCDSDDDYDSEDNYNDEDYDYEGDYSEEDEEESEEEESEKEDDEYSGQEWESEAGEGAGAGGGVHEEECGGDMPALVGLEEREASKEGEEESGEMPGLGSVDGESDEMPGLGSDEEDEEGERAGAGPALLLRESEEGAMPELQSDVDSSVNNEDRGGPGVAAGRQRSWLASVPDDDFVVVAAVTLGQLTRRFLTVLGLTSAPTPVNAMLLRTADRLRSLSSLEYGRDDVVRAVRLLLGHLFRIGATSAELVRCLQYLVSAMEQTNLFLLQLAPGYINLQGDRAQPNLGLLTRRVPVAAIVGGGGVGVGAAAHESFRQAFDAMMQEYQQFNGGVFGTAAVATDASRSGSAQSGTASSTAAGTGGADRPAGARTAPRQYAARRSGAAQLSGINPAAAAAAANGTAAATGTAAGANAIQRAIASLPPLPREMMESAMHDMGVASGEGADRLLGRAGAMLSAINRLLVTSLDVSAIAQEVHSAAYTMVEHSARDAEFIRALQPTIGDASAHWRAALRSARAAGDDVAAASRAAAAQSDMSASPELSAAARAAEVNGAALAAQVAPLIAAEVRTVLQRHMARLGQSPDVQELGDVLLGMLGIDLSSLGGVGAQGPPAAAQGADEGGSAAAAPAPAPAEPSQRPGERQPQGAALEQAAAVPPTAAVPAQPAPAPAAAVPASLVDSGAAAAQERRRPAGLGLGGGLQPRAAPRRAHPTAAPPSTTPTPYPSPAPTPTPASGPQPRSAPPAAQPAAAPAGGIVPAGGGLAALLDGGGSGGGGGGLGGLMQSMMQSPVLMEMARSPALQQMAEQVLGGGGRGGASGGLDISHLMGAAGPMLSQFMGMPPPPQAGGRAAPGAAPTALDLDAALQALPEEEAARWKATIEADEAAQAAVSAPQQPFSDAYLAAMPPSSSGGLLESLEMD